MFYYGGRWAGGEERDRQALLKTQLIPSLETTMNNSNYILVKLIMYFLSSIKLPMLIHKSSVFTSLK